MAMLRQFGPSFPLSYTVGNPDMEESAKFRRAELIEKIRRYRDTLSEMKFADNRAPSSAKEAIASRSLEITEKVRSMEKELHELNVQLIREETSGHTPGQPMKSRNE
jgi:hypothetical protein